MVIPAADVAVIITTFNGLSRGFLKEALDSVLNQTLLPAEIILVDDGSTDSTSLKIGELYRDRIIIKVKPNGGISSARNYGIKNSKSRFVCFLDDDDVWKPDKIELQIKYFTSHPEVDLIFGAIEIIDREGIPLKIKSPAKMSYNFPSILSDNPVLGPSGIMISRKALDATGEFDERFSMAEDYDYWIRLAKLGWKIDSVDQVLISYRIHNHQATNSIRRAELGALEVIDLHTSTKIDFKMRNDYLAGAIIRAGYRQEWAYLRELLKLKRPGLPMRLVFKFYSYIPLIIRKLIK